MKKFLAAFLILIFSGCSPSAGNLEGIFETYLGPVPANVTLLEGKSNNFIDVSANLVFTTDRQTFINLAQGYKPNSLQNALVKSSEWFHEDIKSLSKAIVFHKSERSEKREEYWLFWDDANKKAYFHFISY